MASPHTISKKKKKDNFTALVQKNTVCRSGYITDLMSHSHLSVAEWLRRESRN